MNTIPEIIKDFSKGLPVVLTDDEKRENEGDVIFAAQTATPELINFMIKHARGLICVPMKQDRIERLGLRQMVNENRDFFRTAFTVSVDAAAGITTGISAYDRAMTIKLLSDPGTSKEQLVQPGHVFPIEAKNGGVLVRAGHTEASVDLAMLSGMEPVAVICEIINDDGTMARSQQLADFCKTHNLKMGTIAGLIEYRRRTEKLVERVLQTKLPTQYGVFSMYLYTCAVDSKEHIALVMGDINDKKTIPVRVHSECLTGDTLRSMRCDCGQQLDKAMEYIGKAGCGVILYLRQEGRGIGLKNKLKAYALQDKGLDTIEANEKLGFEADLREYGIGAQILADLGVKKIELLTNNPKKVVGLGGFGLEITAIKKLAVPANKYNEKYLTTKKEKMGHLL